MGIFSSQQASAAGKGSKAVSPLQDTPPKPLASTEGFHYLTCSACLGYITATKITWSLATIGNLNNVLVDIRKHFLRVHMLKLEDYFLQGLPIRSFETAFKAASVILYSYFGLLDVCIAKAMTGDSPESSLININIAVHTCNMARLLTLLNEATNQATIYLLAYAAIKFLSSFSSDTQRLWLKMVLKSRYTILEDETHRALIAKAYLKRVLHLVPNEILRSYQELSVSELIPSAGVAQAADTLSIRDLRTELGKLLDDCVLLRMKFPEERKKIILARSIIGPTILVNATYLDTSAYAPPSIAIAQYFVVLLHEVGHLRRSAACSHCWLHRTPEHFTIPSGKGPEAGDYCIWHILRLSSLEAVCAVLNMTTAAATVLLIENTWKSMTSIAAFGTLLQQVAHIDLLPTSPAPVYRQSTARTAAAGSGLLSVDEAQTEMAAYVDRCAQGFNSCTLSPRTAENIEALSLWRKDQSNEVGH